MMTPCKCFITTFIFVFVTHLAFSISAGDVEDYLPIVEGRKWNYQVKKFRTYALPDRNMNEEIVGTYVERIDSISTEIEVDVNVPVFLLIQEIEETNLRTGKVTTAVLESYVTSEPNQVLLHAQRARGVPQRETDLERYAPPVALLKLPLPEGDEAYPSIMKSQGMIIDSRPFAKDISTVKTSAGTFKDCLCISTHGPVSGAMPGLGQTISDGFIQEMLWFAKGVGLVMQHQRLHLQLDMGGGQQLELTEEKTKSLTAYKE